ncbi:Mitochondrial GTPase 1 [Escovopsis weberi]|uniref:Mitochondrial GTPase 1 n=1 Tax=Escovopsis weberi TaxID=150374 RepID=A0A0N0RTZ2_ESCWE|nr:Mitochondrial GTPase 1 [Escovopsis weberi]
MSLVLECRDFRLPLSTRNPKLEQAIAGCQRLIIYTKADLGSDSHGVKGVLSKLHGDDAVYWNKNSSESTRAVFKRLQVKAREMDSLTGLRVLIVGMPNVGKSTLLNALRSTGLPGKAKAAKTGDQAGVTRKLGTSVRIMAEEKDRHALC